MTESIWAGMIYGAIGGGLGALLGVALGRFLGASSMSRFLTVILAVIGVAVGGQVAKPMLDPVIGKYLGNDDASKLARADGAVEAAMEEIRRDPLLSAIMAREPDFENAMRAELVSIIAGAKSPDDARREATALGASMGATRLTAYATRATAAALTVFTEEMISVIDFFAESDPEFCHAFLYRPRDQADFGDNPVQTKLGPARFGRMQEAGAAMVRSAFDEAPDYDRDTAQLIVNAAGQMLYQRLGDTRIDMITVARKPANAEEAEAACTASADLYRFLLDSDVGVDAVRHLMALSAG